MSKKLTLEDRYYISMYSRRLPCSIPLRFSIDKFLNQIEITPEEFKIYNVDIDPSTMSFKCNDSDYEVEYEEFPPEVIVSMKNFIADYDHDKNKDNNMIQKTFDYFRKVI